MNIASFIHLLEEKLSTKSVSHKGGDPVTCKLDAYSHGHLSVEQDRNSNEKFDVNYGYTNSVVPNFYGGI